MIRRAGPEDEARFLALLGAERFLGGRMRTAWQCYSGHPAAAGFYLADGTGALLVQGAGTLMCGTADAEELDSFLRFCGVRAFMSERVRPAGWGQRPRMLMRCDNTARVPAPALPGGVLLDEAPGLWALAQAGILEGVAPDAWYADACLRRNRGLSHIVAAMAGGAPVATAGVYSLQPEAAYITAVATLPVWRGQGLAGALVAHLARTYAASRPVQLLCKAGLCRFYERLGFVKEREMTEYTAEGQA